MVRQLQLVCVLLVCVISTGCCCFPGPGHHCGYQADLPVPIPLLFGPQVANFMNSPICGHRYGYCGDCGYGPGQCDVVGDCCTMGPEMCCPPGQPGASGAADCDSCGEPIYPHGHGGFVTPTAPGGSIQHQPSPQNNQPFPAPKTEQVTPAPQLMPEPIQESSAFDTSRVRRTEWQMPQGVPNDVVVLPGQHVSHRELRVAPASAGLRIPPQ